MRAGGDETYRRPVDHHVDWPFNPPALDADLRGPSPRTETWCL